MIQSVARAGAAVGLLSQIRDMVFPQVPLAKIACALEKLRCARPPEASHGPQRRRQRTIIVSTHYALVVVVYTR